jgi:hypothetical protein
VGVGFYLIGRFRGERASLERIQGWFDETCLDMIVGQPQTDDEDTLHVCLHPAAETVRIRDEGETLVVSASTNTVGPGYHEWLCGVVRQLGETFAIDWARSNGGDDGDSGDETGFFDDGDRAELERSFHAWQGTVMRHVRDEWLAPGNQAVRLSMPMDAPSYLLPAAVHTPLGPRDAAWVRAVAEDPSRGRDFYAWWGSGRDAACYLGRALYHMWNNVCWRDPLDDDESYLLDEVLSELERAHALDPTLAYPWREWHELNGYTADMFGTEHELDPDLEAEVERRAQSCTGPLIGYRRGDMRVEPSRDWSLVLPGSFFVTEDDNGSWLAYDQFRTARLSSFRHQRADYMPELDEPGEGEEAFDFGEAPLRGRVFVKFREDEDKGDHWVATGTVAVPGRLAAITLTWTHEFERPWALSTLRTIHSVPAD